MLRVHRELIGALGAGLERDYDLSLGEYEVLLNLADAPPDGLRMSEIAAELVVSRSGLTRLVDRLADRGFVTRARCPSDARGYFAQITAAGAERFAAARGAHLAEVRRRFHSQLDAGELDSLARIWDRLLAPAVAKSPK